MTTLTDRELQTLRNLGNDDAAAEIESLRAKVHTQALQILTLTGEVAGFAADAERYRKGAHGNVKGTQGELGMAWCDFSGHAGSVARVLWVTDAEVDAAIAASKVE